MADLGEPAQVKSAFRRYIVALHPDRIQNLGDSEKTFIATRVFASMTEAFNAFKKENGMK
jgi:DnaJ-class molecular chaperone